MKTRWILMGLIAPVAAGALIGLYVMNPHGVRSSDPLVRLFGFGGYEVATRSMAPTLVAGDRIFSRSAPYRKADPDRGDVVVGQLSGDRAVPFVSRIVGLPGETLSIEAGQVLIDGQPFEEPYADHGATQAPSSLDLSPTAIPESSFFVLGDNRDGKDDSRFRGLLAKDDVLGKVSLILMSDDLRRIGRVR